jgi:hypothetical protein
MVPKVEEDQGLVPVVAGLELEVVAAPVVAELEVAAPVVDQAVSKKM